MIELRSDTFNLYLLGVQDDEALAREGTADVIVETLGGERYAGTVRSLAHLDAGLSGVYLPVTDTIVLRELTSDHVCTAVRDLLEGGVLDEVFLEVLEQVG
jgi:hypothetical protein